MRSQARPEREMLKAQSEAKPKAGACCHLIGYTIAYQVTETRYIEGEGRYALAEMVGRGGFATVWRARSLKGYLRGKDVAVKVIPVYSAGERSRALREGQIAEGLRHENIVETLEVIPGDHEIYLVTESGRGTHALRASASPWARPATSRRRSWTAPTRPRSRTSTPSAPRPVPCSRASPTSHPRASGNSSTGPPRLTRTIARRARGPPSSSSRAGRLHRAASRPVEARYLTGSQVASKTVRCASSTAWPQGVSGISSRPRSLRTARRRSAAPPGSAGWPPRR